MWIIFPGVAGIIRVRFTGIGALSSASVIPFQVQRILPQFRQTGNITLYFSVFMRFYRQISLRFVLLN